MELKNIGAKLADEFCAELEREIEKRIVVQFLVIWIALLEAQL